MQENLSKTLIQKLKQMKTTLQKQGPYARNNNFHNEIVVKSSMLILTHCLNAGR